MNPLTDQMKLYDYFTIKHGDVPLFDLRIHKNGIMVLFLHHDSLLFSQLAQATSGFKFQFNNNIAENISQQSGKSKKGGETIVRVTDLFQVTINDKVINIPIPFKSKPIEINLNLVDNPNLILDSFNGYIAIFKNKWEDVERLRKYFRDEQELTDEEKNWVNTWVYVL